MKNGANKLTEIEGQLLTEEERKSANFSERKKLNEKIMEICTPPEKAEYAGRGTPEITNDEERVKYHLTPLDELGVVRKMVEGLVKKSVDRPYLAREKELNYIGTPVPMAAEKRPEIALELMGDMRDRFRTLMLSLDVCTKCGACVEACHTYLGTADPNNAPVGRVELMRKIYKRYFTSAGRTFGGFAGGEDISQETINNWYKYFYQCNECRRCAVFCPFGIDTCEITIMGRQMLTKMGMVPDFVASVVKGMVHSGNNINIPAPAYADTCEFLEEELKEETGKDIRIPIDKEGAEVLFNPSSSEFFVAFDTIKGAAKMFHAAGTDWTLSSKILETANFGLFFDYDTMKKHNNLLYNEAVRLKAKRIIAGECGHGWRTWKMFSSQLSKPLVVPITHLQDETLDYLNDGRIKVDKSLNPLPTTIQDPCNMARACGYIEQPRQIVKAVCEDFRDCWPRGDRNFCCGGGSGILMDELMDLRMKFSKPKAAQVYTTGALMVATPCAICKAQLPNTMAYWNTGATIHGIIDLVGYAIVL
ncbi:sulfate reduction electron transfer complex DsrMKJOP subunit DsrK [Chloroflexota bacterium]